MAAAHYSQSPPTLHSASEGNPPEFLSARTVWGINTHLFPKVDFHYTVCLRSVTESHKSFEWKDFAAEAAEAAGPDTVGAVPEAFARETARGFALAGGLK